MTYEEIGAQLGISISMVKKYLAIGLRHGTTAHVAGNELERKGGMPPMIAVGEASRAVIAGSGARNGGRSCSTAAGACCPARSPTPSR